MVTTLFSAFAIVLLPRQFHVAVVENHDPRGIRTAAWLFPAYLVLINLVVAARDRRTDDVSRRRDRSRPHGARAAAERWRAWGGVDTMIGGLSAATAMVVVDSVALAITISNDLVMPILLRRGARTRAVEGEIGARVLRAGASPSRRAGARLH